MKKRTKPELQIGSKSRMSGMVNPLPRTPSDAARLLENFRAHATSAGFRIETYGRADPFPLLALTRRSPGIRPRIYLSAGIHGDEPAPPLALLALLQAGCFDDRASWFICPVLNPVGLQNGHREDAAQRDLNRDYQDRLTPEVRQHTAWLERQPPFDLTLCLHEDWESSGFYLYELNPECRPSLANAMINAVCEVMPIESADVIDGRKTDAPGIIRPVSDPLLRQNWPEAIYLRHFHTSLSYTLETPSALPLTTRVAALRLAVTAALRAAIRD